MSDTTLVYILAMVMLAIGLIAGWFLGRLVPMNDRFMDGYRKGMNDAGNIASEVFGYENKCGLK